MALESKQNEGDGDLSPPQSPMAVNRGVEKHGNEPPESSLHQVDSAHSLQRVETAGIPPVPVAEFKPTARLFLAFGTLAVITLMVALDGTSLSVALPVGSLPPNHSYLRCSMAEFTLRLWRAP